MRIAIVAANQQIVGGAETYLAWLLPALLLRGHQLAFAFEHPTTAPERAVDRGIEPLVRWNVRAMDRATFLVAVASFNPDLVFLQGCDDETVDIALAERFCAVLFAHMFYAACATGWRVHRIPERKICNRRFGPACLPINYLRGCGARNPLQLLHLYENQRGRSKVLRRLGGLVVASQYMRRVYVELGVPEGRIQVIPCPAERAPDPDPPAARESLNRVLFLGRLTSGKGGVRGIQATARAQRSLGKPLHLTVAGTGPELDRCRRFAGKLGIETDFPGWVGPDRRLELLRQANALIVPSMWPEPFGIVGLEAASAGVPAVAYGVGGIVDWLRPGETGELADGSRFTVHALAAALERVLGSADHYRKLQLGAWRMASEFGGAGHLARLEAFFHVAMRR